jgi:hypothetical protein
MTPIRPVTFLADGAGANYVVRQHFPGYLMDNLLSMNDVLDMENRHGAGQVALTAGRSAVR